MVSSSTVPVSSQCALTTVPESLSVSSPHDTLLLETFQAPFAPTPTKSSSPERLTWRLTSAFFVLFTLGWGDGVTGTLLPYFKKDFDLSFMTSSLLFVASASGYAIGTCFIELVVSLLGRVRFSASKCPPLSSFPSFHREKELSPDHEEEVFIVGFSVVKSRFFTLVIYVGGIRYLFIRKIIYNGNVYVSTASKRGLGYMYGSWAIGAFGAPLVCQSIIATGIRWANFYFGSLVLSALNACLIIYAFWPTRSELQRDADLAWSMLRSPSTPDIDSSTAPAPPVTVVSTSDRKQPSLPSPTGCTAPVIPKKNAIGPRTYTTALRKPKMWASAVFAMIYTGSESSTQGFIVIYLLSVRNANPNTAGYVISGFWGGMAISRFLWGYLGAIITFRQRKWIVHGCIFLALCMHLLIWFIPSFIENAFSTAVIGLVYGPIYPANLVTARDLLPTEVHLVSLAIVAAFASIGAALFPFMTGTLSTLVGPQTLPYITVSQCVVLFGLWALFPSQIPAQL